MSGLRRSGAGRRGVAAAGGGRAARRLLVRRRRRRGRAGTSPATAPSCRCRRTSAASRSQLSGDTIDGAPLDLADLRGKPVVLNVWALGLRAVPQGGGRAARRGHRASERANASFVGINTGDQLASAKAFERTFARRLPEPVRPGGDLLIALRGAVPPNALPTTLVLDRAGPDRRPGQRRDDAAHAWWASSRTC